MDYARFDWLKTTDHLLHCGRFSHDTVNMWTVHINSDCTPKSGLYTSKEDFTQQKWTVHLNVDCTLQKWGLYTSKVYRERKIKNSDGAVIRIHYNLNNLESFTNSLSNPASVFTSENTDTWCKLLYCFRLLVWHKNKMGDVFVQHC